MLKAYSWLPTLIQLERECTDKADANPTRKHRRPHTNHVEALVSFSFFPAKDDVSLQDPHAGGINSIEDIREAQSSDTLIVAFSGGATNKIGLARLEFRRMLSQPGSATRNADQLYVLDQTGMSFYEHQIEVFQRHLALCLRPYQKVVFLGNCMGATAAL